MDNLENLMVVTNRFAVVVAAALTAAVAAVRVEGAVDIDAKAHEVIKSLVAVEYTAQNENASREESGQGIVVSKEGVILVSGGLIPETFPNAWIKDLKVRLPLKNFTSVPAKFLGRTSNHLFAFLKTTEPIDAPVFTPGGLGTSALGQEVFGVAILGKAGGYQTYVGTARVKTILELTHTLVDTQSFGLTRGSSPVFDLETGKVVGITSPALGEGMFLRDSSSMRAVQLIDNDQSSGYFPSEEIAPLFKDIPTKPFEARRPWLAVDEITGLPEDVRTIKNIQQVAGVMIGAVIPNEPADKAGVQAQDIVLTVDGKPFSTSPVPEIMVMHFQRVLEKHEPGDKITLGILRDGKNLELPVTLGTSPKTPAEMPHVFSPRVGVVTRDLVFTDAYARHLPQDTKGVVVALVKNGSPAGLGSTPLHANDLITKVNDQPVENQEQFLAAMKKIEESPDQKEAVFVVIQPDGNTQVAHVDLTK